MSFLTYQETRPWAKAIKSAVLTKKMPPWFADPKYGHFLNERRLCRIRHQGADRVGRQRRAGRRREGQARAAEFTEGWNIKPDITIEMPNAFEVPAKGIIEYQYIVIPTHFEKDVWVKAAEVRPGNRAVMHHVIVYVRPPGSHVLEGSEAGDSICACDVRARRERRGGPPSAAQGAQQSRRTAGRGRRSHGGD